MQPQPQPDHNPMSKLLASLKDAMAQDKISFGPEGVVGPMLSGREHRTDEADLEKFRQVVKWLAQMTFGKSDCVMPWVDVKLVDRTRNESLSFVPLPYTHKAETEEDYWCILQLAQLNLAIAARSQDTAMKIYQDVRTGRRKT